ncbi:hypothetical protein [Streptomyces iranensis]|uniref:hypothetical protein n=1 Tax=Streptomyces iranensis TaxID=576784 RepID=UPI0039B741F8
MSEKRMPRVLDWLECGDAVLESDPWIEFKVIWDAAGPRQPLYWIIDGAYGGSVEVKVDPDTGALLQVIVIDSPPSAPSVERVGVAEVADRSVPVIDRTEWGVKDNPDYSEPAVRKVQSVEELSFSRHGGRLALGFSSVKPVVRLIRCGQVSVGVSEDGMLCEVLAECDPG